MKSKFLQIVLLATIIVFFISSCAKSLEEEGIYSTTKITGCVYHGGERASYMRIELRINDADVYAWTTTDDKGYFVMEINWNDFANNQYSWYWEGNYYYTEGLHILIGNNCYTLKGCFGKREYDLGILY